MSKEKQIEDMAQVMVERALREYPATQTGFDVKVAKDRFADIMRKYAKDLYNQGYRKQSTAKWGDPIFVGDAWAVPCPRCFYATAIRHKEIRPRYCSNCGALMNGEEQKPDPRLLEGYRDGLLIAISGELHIPIDVLLKISEGGAENESGIDKH